LEATGGDVGLVQQVLDCANLNALQIFTKIGTAATRNTWLAESRPVTSG
jgi:site-specific recombinase XerD